MYKTIYLICYAFGVSCLKHHTDNNKQYYKDNSTNCLNDY